MEEDLENFHCLLKELRANGLQRQGIYREGSLHSFDSSIETMKSDYLIEFSNVLFNELVRQSENLHALLRGPLDGALVLDSKVQFTRRGFILLLRCCLVMLHFLEFDMSLVWEKCGVLFKILGKLFTQNLASNSCGCSVMTARESFSQCCNCVLGEINEEADQLHNFNPLILEVFIAELSENIVLIKHLIPVNVFTTNSEKLCECGKTHADNCLVLKLVFSHFLQSLGNDLDFSRFVHSLSGSSDIAKTIPEIPLDISLKLISPPFILSAPLILQAHLILLASRCISTRHLPIEGRKSDIVMMSYYINPFELSVDLYLSYLSTLQLDGVILSANRRFILGDSSVHKMASDKLTHQANDLVDFSHLYSEDILSGTKSEVIAYSASYIHGNHPLIDQLCKDATCLVVDYMIKSIIPMKVWEQRQSEIRERVPQEVYCLAAAIKLMNSLLLHIIWLLRQTGCHKEMTALRDSFPHMAYECLSQSASIIRVSGCGADQQVQNFLYDMLGAYGGVHQEIKFMLAHISSLLVFSFKRKLDFLWKGCISIMMTLMNLLLLEERSLGLSKIFKLLQNPRSTDYEGLASRSTSVIIAKNLENSRNLYLKNELKNVHVEEDRPVVSKKSEADEQSRICSVEGLNYKRENESQASTCNGERFIRCVSSYHTDPSEWDDLVDFIECSPEKDYFSWLKNRNKFNKWKQEKSALFKKQKKSKKIYINKFCHLQEGALSKGRKR